MLTLLSDRTWLTETMTRPRWTRRSCSTLVWAFIYSISATGQRKFNFLRECSATLDSLFVPITDLSDTRSLFLPGPPAVPLDHSDLLHPIDAHVGQLQGCDYLQYYIYLCTEIYKYDIDIETVQLQKPKDISKAADCRDLGNIQHIIN